MATGPSSAITTATSPIACEDPSGFINTLKDKYTGYGPLEYHLGCDYHLDPDGTLGY